eukprot:INCI10671.1.p1 GENE.INCI10671.1~~INCI10671.1.p1  ORF type:complete len:701 (+),score=111.53 INCI10671.1:105-2207(+)
MDSEIAELRSARYRQRCKDVLDSADDADGMTSLSFEDCFEVFAGSNNASPVSTPSSSSSSSRSSSPDTSDGLAKLASSVASKASDDGKCSRRRRRSRSLSRVSPTSTTNSARANTCSRHTANTVPMTPSTKNSPVSVLDVTSADTMSSMSLDELLAFQSSKAATEPPSAGKDLNFSFFDSLSPRTDIDRNLAPVIASVTSDTCTPACVQRLLELLQTIRQTGATSCELNAVAYNRLMTSLVEKKEYRAASEVLDVMVQEGVSLTTVQDAWVLLGRLDAAVELLRTLEDNAFPVPSERLQQILLSWVDMGPAGLHAASSVCRLLCARGFSLSARFSENLVVALLGTPVRRRHNSSFPHLTPAAAAKTRKTAETLERMLVYFFESPRVNFEAGTIATLLHTLENGSHCQDPSAPLRCHLCDVVRRLCSQNPSRQPCVRGVGCFVRMALRQHHYDTATELLRSLACTAEGKVQDSLTVDSMFLTSAMHAIAAAAVDLDDHFDGIDAPEERSTTGLLETARALSDLAAATETAQVSYSVLNQALNTLKALATRSSDHAASSCVDERKHFERAALVGAALFEGLHTLHRKAVNRRTFDRLFDLLFSTDLGGKGRLSDSVMGIVHRVHTAAMSAGFALSPSTVSKLAALGIGGCEPRSRSTTTAPIDIETMVSRSSSSDKLYALSAGTGSPSSSAPAARVAFEQCN